MAKEHLTDKLAVILHADVAGSTQLVQRDQHLAHKRIQESFRRFGDIIEQYGGGILELRGDALLAEFERASDAVSATLAFQTGQATYLSQLEDELKPAIRAGIAMGEVVLGDNTVTGEGVILSQRVEQLAEPGGLCITAALHEAMPHRLPFDLEDTGDQTLKGFDDPVRVYRVKLRSGATIPPPRQGNQSRNSKTNRRLKTAVPVVIATIFALSTYLLIYSPLEPEMPLPENPSIAVLPFTNVNGDAEQEYFVDGITNDLTTDISKVPGLFVIARNTMFAYKGKVVDFAEVAEELGVRYVMAGSVERADNQVRINAQLIDATTGGQVWAERHDGALDDVFSMRDEMTRKIVTSLSVRLGGQHMGTTSIPEVYDAFLRASKHYRLQTPEAYARAIPYLETAIELDPNFARAHAMLAMIYSRIYTIGWAEGTGVSYDDAFRKVNRHLGEAMKNPTPLGHRAAAQMHEYFGSLDKAMIAVQRAIGLDPNDPEGYDAMSSLLVNLDRASEGLELVKKAMRLDPQSDYLHSLGAAQFHMERYDEAAETLLRATKRNPRFEKNYLLLAASYGNLGREQEAMSTLATFNSLYHDPSDKQRPLTLVDLTEYHKSEAGLKRLREGLRIAGMPEGVASKPAHLKFIDLVTVSAGTFDVEGAIEIDAAEAKNLHDRGIAFIDSRGKDLYESGHIPGATHLFFHQVWDGLAGVVSTDAEIVFYCDAPDCHLAAHSSAQAITLGYPKVYYFAGGFSAWKNAGYSIEGS